MQLSSLRCRPSESRTFSSECVTWSVWESRACVSGVQRRREGGIGVKESWSRDNAKGESVTCVAGVQRELARRKFVARQREGPARKRGAEPTSFAPISPYPSHACHPGDGIRLTRRQSFFRN